MNSPDPSFDPQQTVDYEVKPQPDTVDVSQDISTSIAGPNVPTRPPDAPRIPGFRIDAEIAKGGMGRVYAGHDLTLDREVAIKTLLRGADTARFVTEAKITAKLPHPNIPPVHALGTLDDGTPWLAMKRIHGQTLAKLLANRERGRQELSRYIQIFEQIAQAVGFAHSRGIIHRDLKPLNVMVGEFGEVQVMDWGLAKELKNVDKEGVSDGTDADTVHHTVAGAVMGTPGYMAPEQARGEVVDARADVFALGSILAAVLTGKPAFVGTTARETIAKAASGDLADVLARLEKCGADAELLSISRRCLAASSQERYADGREVASAVAGYRATVEARLRQAETAAAEALVRESEQRKRRRLAMLAGGSIAAVLLVGLGASLWQMNRAVTAEGLAKKNEQQAIANAERESLAKQEAENQRERAEQEKAAAERNLAFAKKGNEILGSVFTGMDPMAEYGTVAEFRDALKGNLREAVHELEGSAIGEPSEVATMQDTLGMSLLGLGESKLAITLFEKSAATRQMKLGFEHPDTLDSMNKLAMGYKVAGQLDKALPLYEETLKLRKAKLGYDHPDTFASMNNLAMGYRAAGQLDEALRLLEETHKLTKAKLGYNHHDTLTTMENLAGGYRDAGQLSKALPLWEETLKLQQLIRGADHPLTLLNMNNLALGYQDTGQLDKALPLWEQTLKLMKAKLGPDHPDTLTCMSNLATGYQDVGQLDKALPLLEETLKLWQAKLGPDHPKTLSCMASLASAYYSAGQVALALPLLEKTLNLFKSKLGPDHPNTLTCMNNLAFGYQAAGQLEKALPLSEETLKLRKAKLGPDHPSTLICMNNLGALYQDLGQLDKAMPLKEQTLKLMKSKLGSDHPDTLHGMNNLAFGYQAVGQLDKALPLYEETLKLRRAKLGPDHPHTLLTMSNLASGYQATGQLEKALPLWEETVKLQQAKLGPDDPDTLTSKYNLGKAYRDANQLEKAIPLLQAFLAGHRKLAPKDDPRFAGTLAQVGLDMLKCDHFATAEEMLRECLAIREKQEPEAWTTFNTMSMLGGALLGQKKYADAEPLLVKGYEGMKSREETIPPQGTARIPEALDRLIELYTALTKPEEVTKYQELRTQYLAAKQSEKK